MLAVFCPEQEPFAVAKFVHDGASDAVKKMLPKPNSIIKTFYRHRNKIANVFDSSEVDEPCYSNFYGENLVNDFQIDYSNTIDDVQAFSNQLDAIFADPITGKWIKFDSEPEVSPLPISEMNSTLTIDDLLCSETIE